MPDNHRKEVSLTDTFSQVEETGQKNTVLTLYELMHGEATVSQGATSVHPSFPSSVNGKPTSHSLLTANLIFFSAEFHGMDPDVMLKSLNVLVKRGKAQVFGSDDQPGVKFF